VLDEITVGAAREAHRIKGAARLVGASELAQRAGVIEQMLRDSAATAARPDLASLRAALADLRVAGREG
jgi:HPt (histidine-containing phosphotransfer) domain-containing protein